MPCFILDTCVVTRRRTHTANPERRGCRTQQTRSYSCRAEEGPLKDFRGLRCICSFLLCRPEQLFLECLRWLLHLDGFDPLIEKVNGFFRGGFQRLIHFQSSLFVNMVSFSTRFFVTFQSNLIKIGFFDTTNVGFHMYDLKPYKIEINVCNLVIFRMIKLLWGCLGYSHVKFWELLMMMMIPCPRPLLLLM